MFRKNVFLLVLHGFFALLIAGCAGTVIKMPKPLPDIVSAYKSVVVKGDRPGMFKSGLRVKPGDYVTIIAKGEIDVWPGKAGYVYAPISLLLYRIGEKVRARRYFGFESFTVGEGGNIYLGVIDGPVDPYGEPFKPEYYSGNVGHFVADIIVWQKEDVIQIANFIEERGNKDLENKELKMLLKHFKYLKENLLARKETKEVEEPQEETTESIENEVQEEKESAKEKQVPEAKADKIQESKQGEKPVVIEDSKAKVSIITKPIKSREKETNPPQITLLSPDIRQEIRVSSKTSRIIVVGRATDESGAAEVTVNGEVAELDEKGNFSADTLLKIEENEISVAAMDIHRNQATQSFKVI